MKLINFVLGAGICLCLVFATSCKKKDSYKCECVYTSATGDTLTDSNHIGEMSSMADAEVECNKHRDELLGSGATTAACQTSVVE